MRDIDLEYYEGLLREIGEIVRTPTKATAYRKATDHYKADFDMIRKIVAIGLTRPVGQSNIERMRGYAQVIRDNPETDEEKAITVLVGSPR